LRYYHLLALQKLMAVREDLASVSRDAATAIEAMAAAGQASKAELLQARVEAREQLAALQNVRAIHQAVWRRMAVTIGQPDLPVGPLAGDLEQCCAMPGFEAAWAHVLEANPDLLIARGEVARRQATLRQSLSGSTCKSGNCDKAASDGLIGQAMSLFGGTNPTHDPQVKQAAWTDLSQWEAEVGRIEQSLKQKLADAYARHERAKEVTDLYYMQNLPDAKEAFELSVIGYRQGRGSWPQVQIAQRNYFRISTEYVEALAELRRAELVVLGLLMDAPEESTTQTAQK
jgi:cobalt-zinc-cadmium efflux system outer membrane protein